MPIRSYDPKQVLIIVGGVPMQGFADGSFATIERDEDAFTKIVGSDGEVSRAKSNNKSGLLTLTLHATSPSNDVLSGFASLDELSNSGVVPVFVKDNSGRSVFVSAEGWVRRLPSSEYSNEITNREWAIDLGVVEFFSGGN